MLAVLRAERDSPEPERSANEVSREASSEWGEPSAVAQALAAEATSMGVGPRATEELRPRER